MQKGHIFILAGRRVPSEKMVMMGADLADGVMMADVVVIDLREGDANEADHEEGIQQPQADASN